MSFPMIPEGMCIRARVIKARIQFDNVNDEHKLLNSQRRYAAAMNYVSEYIFNHDFDLVQTSLRKALYHDLRNMFSLKSAIAQQVIADVIATYKSHETMLKKEKVPDEIIGYDKNEKPIFRYISKDLTFLCKSHRFKKPQMTLQCNIGYSFLKNSVVSILTLQGRVKAHITMRGFEKYLDSSKYRFGAAKPVYRKGKWYLHIAVSELVKEITNDDICGSVTNIVGIDRGIRHHAVCFDGSKTSFVDIKQGKHRRRKYANTRASLQSKHTRSAQRRMKRIGLKENRWMHDENHCITKTLSNSYPKGTLFVLEGLSGITLNTVDKVSKKQRKEHVDWPWFMFETYLTFKAIDNGQFVLTVSPKYTSQRCARCGNIDKTARNHAKHVYSCKLCGFTTNDDRNAAMNIRYLGEMFINGNDNPRYKKP